MTRQSGVMVAAVLGLAVQGAMSWGEGPATTRAGEKGVWVPLAEDAFPKKTKGGVGVGTPGRGIIQGLAVDRTTGDVYAALNKLGIWKSTDQGATFQEPETVVTGRPMYTFAFNADPAGKRVACFLIYGSGGTTTDAGKTWTAFKTEAFLPKVFDVGAVDWEVTGGKSMLVMTHEANGKLVFTTDAGATWSELGTGFNQRGPFGVFDEKTLIGSKTGREILRSTDAGKTWNKVDVLPGKAGQIVYVSKGAGYLITEKGLLVTKDQGATWAIQGEAVKATIGPFFGKDAQHFAAVGGEGVFETVNGGKTWKLVAPPAPGFGPLDMTYAWDPVHDVFYIAQGNKPAMKCVVGAGTPGK